MVIYGWLQRAVVLGTKADLCAVCGAVTPHAILRLVSWAHVFWVPFLPFLIRHRLTCTECGTERKLGFRQVRRALRERRLPLQRDGFKAWAVEAFEQTGRMPQEAELDPVEPNPRRGPWDLYLKAYPAIVAGLVLAVVLLSSRPPAPAAAAPTVPTLHACWEASDGSISGCRMEDGTMVGRQSGTERECWFVEPLTEQTRMICEGDLDALPSPGA